MPGPTLEAATVQEIQLELLRRTEYNAMDGARIVRDLLAHREKWEAVMLTRFGGSWDEPNLITLRDLSQNIWNADTLYVLAVDRASADWLVAQGDTWASEQPVVLEGEAAARALGSWGDGRYIVQFWWD